MKKLTLNRRASVLVVLVAIGAFAMSAVAAIAGSSSKDDFIRPDGSVDMAKAPHCIGVAGPDGEALMRPDGRPLLVPFTPPGDDLPMEELAGTSTSEEFERIKRDHPEGFAQAEKRQNPAFERQFLITKGQKVCYGK